MVTIAEGILRTVGDAGASAVFGIPGVHNLAFWDAAHCVVLPRLVNVRHEQTAVHAADGWSRATGRLGAAFVTTGPGAANCAAAFGEAAMARSPVLLIATEVTTRLRKLGLARTLHESKDQAGMFRTLAKGTWTPRDPDEVPRAVEAAIATALEHPRGPVYVDIPTDLLSAEQPTGWWAVPTPWAPSIDPDLVRRVAQSIDEEDAVGIWAGGGAIESSAVAAVVALAEKLHAPIFTTFSSRGLVSPDCPWLVTLPPHEPEVANLLGSLDVLIGVGSDFDGMLTKNATLLLPPMVIDVNLLAEKRNIGYPQAVPVVQEASSFIAALVPEVRARDTGPGDEVSSRMDRAWARLRADHQSAEACAFLAAVGEHASKSVIVSDMCVAGYWFGSYYAPEGPRRLQYPIGWGTLGYALPAAVGAGFAVGAAVGEVKRVLVVAGDAGVLFGVGELATVAENGLPVTLLVVDDRGYGMLRFDKEHAGATTAGMDLQSPDFAMLARSFGLRAIDAGSDIAGLRKAIASAMADTGPNVVVWHAALYPPRSTSPRWSEPPS